MMTAWRDKRVITMISSNQPPGVTNGKPTVVRAYNEHMGGVDKADQHRAYYPVGHSSKKWWRTVFAFVVNICLVQSMIAWSKSPHPPNTPKYDNLFLRARIAEQLRGGFTSRKVNAGRKSNVQTVAEQSILHHKLVRATKRRKCAHCIKMGTKTPSGWQVATNYECKWCHTALCRGACFRDWHINQNINQNQ